MTEEHLIRALTMMIQDADKKGEIGMICMYFRDPKKPTELSPMGQCTFNIISTTHLEFDKQQFDYFISNAMTQLKMKETIKRNTPKPPYME